MTSYKGSVAGHELFLPSNPVLDQSPSTPPRGAAVPGVASSGRGLEIESPLELLLSPSQHSSPVPSRCFTSKPSRLLFLHEIRMGIKV
ncbi:hypothetical protein AAHA92_15843 [Salvia divinorum]|uniref:Uncharacterized protein n=1 Tax=Salvia divinorum TaxID=28513 RepID=A0ABD1GXI4_SALDI